MSGREVRRAGLVIDCHDLELQSTEHDKWQFRLMPISVTSHALCSFKALEGNTCVWCALVCAHHNSATSVILILSDDKMDEARCNFVKCNARKSKVVVWLIEIHCIVSKTMGGREPALGYYLE